MFQFVSWNYKMFVTDPELKLCETGTNRNRPKWVSIRQKRPIRAKQSETKWNKSSKNEKLEDQWVGLCYYSCFLSKVVSSVPPKPRNKRKLAFLFRIMPKLVSVLSIRTKYRRTPCVSEFVTQLFHMQSCYFKFNQNSETSCFAVSWNYRNLPFCFG
jgi:hypothetical protein